MHVGLVLVNLSLCVFRGGGVVSRLVVLHRHHSAVEWFALLCFACWGIR